MYYYLMEGHGNQMFTAEAREVFKYICTDHCPLLFWQSYSVMNSFTISQTIYLSPKLFLDSFSCVIGMT